MGGCKCRRTSSTFSLLIINNCDRDQWDAFAYADKAQEAKRVVAGAAEATARENEQEKRRAARAEKRKLNSAWSEKVEKKEERELRKEKKSRKRKWLKANAETIIPKDENLPKEQEDQDAAEDGDDWAELAREERMAKKVRKGDINQKTFDAEFGVDL